MEGSAIELSPGNAHDYFQEGIIAGHVDGKAAYFVLVQVPLKVDDLDLHRLEVLLEMLGLIEALGGKEIDPADARKALDMLGKDIDDALVGHLVQDLGDVVATDLHRIRYALLNNGFGGISVLTVPLVGQVGAVAPSPGQSIMTSGRLGSRT